MKSGAAHKFRRYALMFLAAAAVLSLLYREYRAETESNRRVLRERGQTILESLTAGIRAQTRMGRYRAEYLRDIFDALSESPDVAALRLATAEGTVIAATGAAENLEPTPGDAIVWGDATLEMRAECVFSGHGPYLRGGQGGPGRGRGMGRGRGGGPPPNDGAWSEWGSSPLTLTVVLDTQTVTAQNRRASVKYGVTSAAVLLLLLLASLVRSARQRQRVLQAGLALAQERAAYHERLAQMGAGFAHETKNPLGLVRGLAQAISDTEGIDTSSREYSRRIIDETDRIVGQINGFLSLARPHPPMLRTVPLDTLFKDLLRLVQQEAQEHRVRITSDAAGLSVSADEDQLRRALLNLLINAVRACDHGGEIRITAHPMQDRAAITVADTGCGIAPEDLPRVKEPYFTRFPHGTGLGLAIVDEIARAHGWHVRISSTQGQGTEVTLEALQAVH